MENSIFIGLSRQVALKSKMNLISNNIANMSTPGYRSQNAVFAQYINKSPITPKVPVKEDISQVYDYGQYQNTAQGSFHQTGNQTDVAINGPGYFGVTGPNGETLYTRAGNFRLNANSQLVTSAGYPVANAGGAPIVVPKDTTEINIDPNGNISDQNGIIGQLMVSEFDNVQKLEAAGENTYRAGGANAIPAQNSVVVQGAIENSNVNPVLEMTRMIDVLRSYQATQSMLKDEHDREINMIDKLTKTS